MSRHSLFIRVKKNSLEGVIMYNPNLIFGGITLLSFIFALYQYARSERIKALHNRTLIQIWNNSKRLLKLVEQGPATERNKAFLEVAWTIEDQLLKAIFDTYRPTDRKIDKWTFEGKISVDEAKRLKSFNR